MAYAALFCVAVAMVLRGIPYWLGLIVIVAALLVLDRRALLGVDWGLLVTFAAFFTFSGNMARIEPVRELFRKLLAHGVMPVAALTSQVISNVPAAILLSQFTDDYPGLLVGVNIGVAGQPDYLSGVHKARQRPDGALHSAVLRHQLWLFAGVVRDTLRSSSRQHTRIFMIRFSPILQIYTILMKASG